MKPAKKLKYERDICMALSVSHYTSGSPSDASFSFPVQVQM